MITVHQLRVGRPLISMCAAVEVKLQLDYIAESLGDKPCILGDSLALADFGLTYICQMADRLGQLAGYPTLKAYTDRNTAQPAFLRARQKTGA